VRLKLRELAPKRAVYNIAPLNERIDSVFADNRMRTLVFRIVRGDVAGARASAPMEPELRPELAPSRGRFAHGRGRAARRHRCAVQANAGAARGLIGLIGRQHQARQTMNDGARKLGHITKE
jgi:hypothetical protein